jgi:AcrR family transcriptional regulator
MGREAGDGVRAKRAQSSSGKDRSTKSAGTSAAEVGRIYGGEPLDARRRDQRERLLAAAREVFAERGYATASIEEIVSAAHVSRTAFYRFFESKEACLLALFDDAMAQLGGALEAVAARSVPPEEKIRSAVRAVVGSLAGDPAMARIVLIEAVGATPAVERARAQARIAFARLLEAEVRDYEPWRHRSSAEIELVAIATLAAISESVSHLVATDRASDWRKLVAPLTRYVLRALTPDQVALQPS